MLVKKINNSSSSFCGIRKQCILTIILIINLYFVNNNSFAHAKRRKRRQSSSEVKFDGDSYDLEDPVADHRSEGIRRSEANDHTGAVESFRAAVKFEKMDKGGAHMNLGVALMRLGNNRDASTAKQIYFDSLENFEKAESLGTMIGDNKKAIYDNCEIRYKEHCDVVFADLRGNVRVLGTYAKKGGDDDDNWDDDEVDDWDDDDDAEDDNDSKKSEEDDGLFDDDDKEDDDWNVEDEDWAE